MSILLDFNFLVVLNLLVMLLWPVGSPYITDKRGVVNVIIIVLSVIAIVFDIVFLVLRLVTH